MDDIDKLLDKPMSEAITEIENNPAKIYGMLMRIRRLTCSSSTVEEENF